MPSFLSFSPNILLAYHLTSCPWLFSSIAIPVIGSLKNEDYLLIVATGHHHTEDLRKKYKQDNIIIEDFVDFDFIMPRTDLYITNGGYGGTLVAIDHALPMVAAGINEGKNEICARIGYLYTDHSG